MTSCELCPKASKVLAASPSPTIENGVFAAKSLRSVKNPFASLLFPINVSKATSICCQSAAKVIALPKPSSVASSEANAALTAPIPTAIPAPIAAPDAASLAKDASAFLVEAFALSPMFCKSFWMPFNVSSTLTSSADNFTVTSLIIRHSLLLGVRGSRHSRTKSFFLWQFVRLSFGRRRQILYSPTARNW